MADASNVPELSIIVPLFNEAESLPRLHQELQRAVAAMDYEILFVNDGSTDTSLDVLKQLQRANLRLRIVTFGRNFGKAEALRAGFQEARGERVVTLDADLQDDPAEIPRLLAALDAGYDLANGRKTVRRDPWNKTIPSRIFNGVTAWLTGLPLRDFNSGFKAYRRQVVKELAIHGEQYRFIPALAWGKGFRVTEVGINHRPRVFGRSKYGPWRFWTGLLDLTTILFLTRFQRKPFHIFGTLGLLLLMAGGAINLYLTLLRLIGEAIGTRPLLQLGVLLMLAGFQLLVLGLLGEMIALSSVKGGEGRGVYQVLEPTDQEERDALVATKYGRETRRDPARGKGQLPEVHQP